ncbi:hypothetical protein [Microbacterium ulmi]|uniref:Uncharacterized protein n=1 Tax=Microbacterium ulmi TaxID=179095 RepID=A0A7Y2LZN4_9MICO|nr:hypothetical protein [Microbacterium ulmi]NII69226.1 hypothetical protein [Microbacterium ulmi]NNH03764.1 hypothetical protein [Microbacterium ulmi]
MWAASFGRFVYIAQWWAAVVLPVFVWIGRVLVGGYAGWIAVLGVLYLPLFVAALLVPPILTLFDRGVKPGRVARLGYSVASALLWVGILVLGAALPDAADAPGGGSALMTWTGMSLETSIAILTGASYLSLAAYIAVLALAVAGIARGRLIAPAT